MLRKIEHKSQDEIDAEWDSLAPVRLRQITSGIDLTYKYVLSPTVISLVKSEPRGLIVDAGCGVGALSASLAACATGVVGIDPSKTSIELADRNFGEAAKFTTGRLEDYSDQLEGQARVVVANMVLMDVLNIHSFLKAVRTILCPNGAFVFSVTHPWFWPEYVGYSSEPWFRYESELLIEAPFHISNDPSLELTSTHVHRSLQSYIELLIANFLRIESLLEPMPGREVEQLYPEPWHYPRYLVGKCRKFTELMR